MTEYATGLSRFIEFVIKNHSTLPNNVQQCYDIFIYNEKYYKVAHTIDFAQVIRTQINHRGLLEGYYLE